MSTMEIELNSMNTTCDDSPVAGDENEQKSIASLDELLEQELKEDDSVDCFIKRVENASEDSSTFSLNYDEAPVVSNPTFFSPKETTVDNNSLLVKEFENTLNKVKEIPVPLASDADKLQSGEETKEEVSTTSTTVEDNDEGIKEIEEREKDDINNENGLDSIENQGDESSVMTEGTDGGADHTDEEHKVVEDTSEEKETDNEVQDSVEVELPSETPSSDTEQTEKDTHNHNVKPESATEVHKDVLYLVFQPKDLVNQNNDSEKASESMKTVQCNEKSTNSGSGIISNTSPDKPAAQTVITIAGSSEAKSVIVKKITAKIVKNNSTCITEPANECEVNSQTCSKESLSNTNSTSEGKEHNEPDDTEDLDTAVHNNDSASVNNSEPKLIITQKICENSTKNQTVLQEKPVPSTEEENTQNTDKDHQSISDEDKNLAVNNITLPVKTEEVSNEVKTEEVSNEENTLLDKLEVGEKPSDEATKKRANFGAVKRKFEEICRISREEEDAAIEEIKRMKKETLDVLRKINAEMEKFKLILMAGK